jgi:nucleoside-diphosphate-sugar epimerase
MVFFSTECHEGTVNVVRQTQQAGVEKIVVTSSFGCLLSRMFQLFWHRRCLTD